MKRVLFKGQMTGLPPTYQTGMNCILINKRRDYNTQYRKTSFSFTASGSMAVNSFIKPPLAREANKTETENTFIRGSYATVFPP